IEYSYGDLDLMPTDILILWLDSLKHRNSYSSVGTLHLQKDTGKISGILLFEMTEKGWQLMNMTEKLS
ncbi:MAG: hypothetical protein MUO85_07215, partial [candidate division Zixibacteria bacterium]|nr:hypothetical protein [candidate division Zixibacteria bacterium]